MVHGGAEQRVELARPVALVIDVDLRSCGELGVVGVYTTAGSTGLVQAIEIERVPARRAQTNWSSGLVPTSEP